MHYTSEAKAQIAGEYVLGLAPRPLVRAVERRLPRDAELEGLVALWRTHLHELGAAVPSTLPMRDDVWRRIAADLPLAAQSNAPTDATARAPWWQQLWLWQGWAVAASAAALVLGMQPQLLGIQPQISAPTVERSAESAQITLQQQTPAEPPATKPSPPAAMALAGATGEAATSPSGGAIDDAPATSAEPLPAGTATASDGAAAPAGTRTTDMLARAANGGDARARSTRGVNGGSTTDGARVEQLSLVGVLATEEGGAAWLVRLDQATGVLKVRVLSAQSAGAERDFELWAVPKDGGPPRSLGVIAGDRDITLPMDARANRSVRQAQLLAVSVEPIGGSQAAGPSGPVKFTGAMLQI